MAYREVKAPALAAMRNGQALAGALTPLPQRRSPVVNVKPVAQSPPALPWVNASLSIRSSLGYRPDIGTNHCEHDRRRLIRIIGRDDFADLGTRPAESGANSPTDSWGCP